MSAENGRGTEANGGAAGAEVPGPAGGSADGGNGSAPNGDGASAMFVTAGVDQASAYVPPTPPPRHARIKTLDMKRVRVASSADPRNAPTQKILLSRVPTPPPGAVQPVSEAKSPEGLKPLTPAPAAVVSEPEAAPAEGEKLPPEQAPLASQKDERHRILQALVVLLSAIAVLIVGGVVIILRMNKQQPATVQPSVTASAPVAPVTQAPVVTETAASAEPAPAVSASALPEPSAVTSAPALTESSAAPSPPLSAASAAQPNTSPTRTAKPVKTSKPESTTPPTPPPTKPTSTISPIFEF